MRLTITVDLDPAEQVQGQPTTATVTVEASHGVAELLALACVETANPHLRSEWRDCAAAIVAARVLAAGLRVDVPTIVETSSLQPAAVRPRLLGA